MNTNETPTNPQPPLQIFIHKDGEQLGPFTPEEALAMERRGEITGDDSAWIEGKQNWVPLSSILRKHGPPPPPKVRVAPPPPPPPAPVSPVSSVSTLAPHSNLMVRRGTQEFGPYTVEVACQYLQAGTIVSTDQAKPDGSSEWLPVTVILSQTSQPATTRRLSHLWLWFTITSILTVILVFSAHYALMPDSEFGFIFREQLETADALFSLSYVALLAAYALGAVMTYRGWQLVERPGAAPTPAQAVGLMFVPLFNFYWQFIAIRGVAVQLNQRFGIGQKPISEGLAIAVCVCTCVMVIPRLAPLALLGYTVTGIIFWKSVMTVVNQAEGGVR